MELDGLLKSFFGSILSFLTWITGKNLEASMPGIEELSFLIVVISGIATLIYTIMKMYDWVCEHRKGKSDGN